MRTNLYFLILSLIAVCMAFGIACESDDGSDIGGMEEGDDDDDNGEDDVIGTNDCGQYTGTDCDDSNADACRSAYLANEDRYNNPVESDCAPNLQWSDELAQVAYAHSQDMCENSYFAHDDLQGNSPFDRMQNAGIGYVAAGENLAMGTSLDADQANDMWMNEPKCEMNHRSNLLSRWFTHVGVGVYECSDGSVYFTQDFASFNYSDLPDGDHPYCGPDF